MFFSDLCALCDLFCYFTAMFVCVMVVVLHSMVL
jgi:hypothetical protein